MLIVILCQGVLPNRGDHLPWGPTRWQRSGHSVCDDRARASLLPRKVSGGGAASGLRTLLLCGLTTDVRQGLP